MKKQNTWKALTAITTTLLILNPELIELAIFIDAIGLEMFIMLLHLHLAAVFSLLYKEKIKPVYKFIKAESQNLILLSPSPAALMLTLVFSALLGVIIK